MQNKKISIMSKIGIIYGSSTGNTEYIAEKIGAQFEGDYDVEIHNVDSVNKKDIEKFDYLILGTSTWGVGDMQDDWDDYINIFREADISKKKIALFGLGDQEVYSESFVDGLGLLFDIIKTKTNIVGAWPATDYRFNESAALKNKKFVGLVLDQENQADKSDERIKKWVEMLKKEFN